MSPIMIVTDRLDPFRELIQALENAGNKIMATDRLDLLDRTAMRSRIDVMIVDLDHPDILCPGPIVLLRERFQDSAIIAVRRVYSRRIDLRLRSVGVVHFAIKPLDTARILEIVLHCIVKKNTPREFPAAACLFAPARPPGKTESEG